MAKKGQQRLLKRKELLPKEKSDAYECNVCGYRLIVDEICGCAEEHVYICCGTEMKNKRAKKTA